MKVFQTVEKGWGPLNPVMGGLDGFRRTMLSFPSIFEMMPRYRQCCDDGGNAAFDPAKAETWTALHWDGVDTATMPDLDKTFVRIKKLEALVATPMPKGVEDVLLVGVDQRTPQRAGFRNGGGASVLQLQHTWSGDGTVIRDSCGDRTRAAASDQLCRSPAHPARSADPGFPARGADRRRGARDRHGAGAGARQDAGRRWQHDRTGRDQGRAGRADLSHRRHLQGPCASAARRPDAGSIRLRSG